MAIVHELTHRTDSRRLVTVACHPVHPAAGTRSDGAVRTYVRRASVSDVVQSVDSGQRKLRLEPVERALQLQL